MCIWNVRRSGSPNFFCTVEKKKVKSFRSREKKRERIVVLAPLLVVRSFRSFVRFVSFARFVPCHIKGFKAILSTLSLKAKLRSFLQRLLTYLYIHTLTYFLSFASM